MTDNTEWNRQQEDAAMERLVVVNRAQCIADHKCIGAMELALERIRDLVRTRQDAVTEARKALELVRKFREETQ